MFDLEEILSHYGVSGKVIGTDKGPLITQIKFRPVAGTKSKAILSVLDDIAREMGVKTLRISNVCEDNCIGFEVPNDEFQTTDLTELLNSDEFKSFKGILPLSLGVKINGTPIFADLAKMPHLLVAGATGSGKSVALNAFIISLITKLKPAELQFVMIDPKRIEFSIYNHQEYMYLPVITENSDAAYVLADLAAEMNRRYALFETQKVKNISEYNKLNSNLPYIVAIVDEFSDLVLSDKQVEKHIQILAQKARAAGIHLILATQRPSVDVVTGSIKANFPSRIAFKTASGTDSKTILDTGGAEDLVGRGDALYLAADGSLTRCHGAYISDEKIEEILKPYRTKKDVSLKEKNIYSSLVHVEEQPSKYSNQQQSGVNSKKSSVTDFFLFAWLIAFWKWLGKRQQKKILKALSDFLLKIFRTYFK